MAEKFEPKLEKPKEALDISKEDFLALRQNEAFLNFVEKIKSSKEDAEQKGIDISQAINYLETGEGGPDLVKKALGDLTQKDIEEFKRAAEHSGSPMSEREIEALGPKTKYGPTLGEFKFFMHLPGLKKKIEAKEAGRPQHPSVERMTVRKILQEGRERSPDWEKKVLQARKEFQESTWDYLRKYVELWQLIEKRGSVSADIIEEAIDLCEFLMKKAVSLAEQHQIGRDEIFNSEKYPEWYISKEYVEGGDFGPSFI